MRRGKADKVAEEQSESAKAKRRVRNPETFRERAIKATEAGDKPSRSSRVRSRGGSVVGSIFRPIGRGLKFIFYRQPFKFIGKIFRFIGLIIFPRYFRESWKELRLVSWPNWKQSRQLTLAVLGFAVVFGAAIAGVDYGLDKLFRHILLK